MIKGYQILIGSEVIGLDGFFGEDDNLYISVSYLAEKEILPLPLAKALDFIRSLNVGIYIHRVRLEWTNKVFHCIRMEDLRHFLAVLSEKVEDIKQQDAIHRLRMLLAVIAIERFAVECGLC